MTMTPTRCVGRGAQTLTRFPHCCVIGGERCPYLIEFYGGRRWACGLLVELGSWTAVEADPRYQPIAEHFGNPCMCREWQPREGECCREVRCGDLG